MSNRCCAECWIGGHGSSYGPPAQKFVCVLDENHDEGHNFGESAGNYMSKILAFENAEKSREASR